MKKINIKKNSLLSVLALGLVLSASAQEVQNTTSTTTTSPAPSEPVAIDPGPGLVGTNYSELSFGYEKQEGAPSILRDYEFVSNGNVYRQGMWGADANFTYDYLDGSASGFSDRRDEAQLGITGFMMQTWGKPFLTVDAGYAWERADDVSRKSFAYTGIAGIEFQVLRNLALSPFIEYQAEPHLYNHDLPIANFEDHLFDYGVKATYRFSRNWNASLSADLDQHSDRDWGLRAGVSYHF
jgi:opacity protein-like surface antigen